MLHLDRPYGRARRNVPRLPRAAGPDAERKPGSLLGKRRDHLGLESAIQAIDPLLPFHLSQSPRRVLAQSPRPASRRTEQSGGLYECGSALVGTPFKG